MTNYNKDDELEGVSDQRKEAIEEDEFFYRLTPDVVLEAVEEARLSPSGHCRALNSLENRVFDIGLNDGSHIVAKFYRPHRWSRDQIQEEHHFLNDLKEEEIPALSPIPFPDEETIKSVHGINYAVWPLTGGREPSEFTFEELEITGRLLARIHNVGAGREFKDRLVLNADRLALQPMQFLIDHKFIPVPLQTQYKDIVRETADIYEELAEGVPVQRIHGDCHIGNLLYGSQGWYFLDFDDCCMGPAAQDIWMISSGRDSESIARQTSFLEAYRLFRDFDESWLKLIEPLRSLRYIHYSAWIARRWKDPAFAPAFPHFGTDDYWLTELNELKEQLNLFKKSSGKIFIMNDENTVLEEEQELTNKDFFWDMDD